MNDRIRELAEQAGLKHHNWITNESNINDGDFKYPRLEDYEKFAELIVGECLEACSRANDIKHFVPPTQEQVVLDCMREIETTFRS